jgi:hypothetical protein
MDDLHFIVMAWLFCTCAAAMIASNRGDNAAEFFFMGLFLGPFGVLLAASKTGKRRLGTLYVDNPLSVLLQRDTPSS